MLGATLASPTLTEGGVKTPLWNRVGAALKALKGGNNKPYTDLFLPKAKTSIQKFDKGAIKQSPFTSATATAAMESCLGPFLVDEGADWVQFSWVCRVEKPTTLRRFVTFRATPEFGVTAWFSGGRIEELVASEVIGLPGAPKVAMGAAEQMGAK